MASAFLVASAPGGALLAPPGGVAGPPPAVAPVGLAPRACVGRLRNARVAAGTAGGLLPGAAAAGFLGLGASLASRRQRRQRRRWLRVALADSVAPAPAVGDFAREAGHRLLAPLTGWKGGKRAEASKIVVALDVDEVLAQYLKAYIVFRNGKRGTSFQPSDFFVYRFWEVTGSSYDDEMDFIYDFHTTDHFRNVEPVPGAQDAIRRLAQIPGVELHIVTSRQENIAQETCRWLEQHFPGVFPEERIHIGNHFGRSGRSISKAEICREIGAGLLIDDCWNYCTELAEAGTPAFLFDLNGSYTWNQGSGGGAHDLVTRVKSWEDAVNLITASLSVESA